MESLPYTPTICKDNSEPLLMNKHGRGSLRLVQERLATLSVAMHSPKEIVDTEISHDDGKEGKHHEHMIGCGATQHSKCLGMQGCRIHHECYQCPHFLGVPSPIFSPRHIGPYSSHKDAYAKCGHSGIEEEERQLLQGKHNVMSITVDATHNDGCDAADEGERQKSETYHYD